MSVHKAKARRRTTPAPPLAVVLARRELAALISLVLGHCGLETLVANDVADAQALVDTERACLVILDAGHDAGRAALLELGGGRAYATLALVELDRRESSFTAFTQGADDVVRVPFTPDELAIRVAQVLRRIGQPTSFVRNILRGGLELSLDEYVLVGSRMIPLGAAQNSLLYLLAANAERHVRRADIRELVWGIERSADDKGVDQAVGQLRRSLGGLPGGVTR